jgi:hypothetical protein
MSVARSIVRMLVLPRVVSLPSPRSLPRDHGPAATRRSPPHEVSPPHGGTPDETECLGMHSPEIHTNREIVNYNKEDPMNVMHLRNKPCYSSSKERGTDEILWTFFHQDWYRTVLYPKLSPVVKQQYVDIEYMRKKDSTSTGYLKLVTCMVLLIYSTLGTTRIKKSSPSSTPLSSMTRKRGSLCG